MKQQEVVDLIKVDFPKAEVLVEGEDCSFSVVVVDPAFDGMGLLQKQKSVLATVKEQITNGALHAMSIKAYTPDKWAEIKAVPAEGLTVL